MTIYEHALRACAKFVLEQHGDRGPLFVTERNGALASSNALAILASATLSLCCGHAHCSGRNRHRRHVVHLHTDARLGW